MKCIHSQEGLQSYSNLHSTFSLLNTTTAAKCLKLHRMVHVSVVRNSLCKFAYVNFVSVRDREGEGAMKQYF